jgi:hypothetical protein
MAAAFAGMGGGGAAPGRNGRMTARCPAWPAAVPVQVGAVFDAVVRASRAQTPP